MKNTAICNVNINYDVNYSQVVKFIYDFIQKGKSGIVCTTNTEFIMAARKDDVFRKIINNSLLSLPDGYGIVLAIEYLKRVNKITKIVGFYWLQSFLAGVSLAFDVLLNDVFSKRKSIDIPIIHGSTLITHLCAMAEDKGLTVFFFGGWPKDKWGRMQLVDYDLATKVSENLLQKFPNLKIVGATSQFSYKESDDSCSLSYIKDCMQKKGVDSVDILFASFNHSKQEKWLNRLQSKIPAKIGIGVGGSFDYVAGNVKRPPKIICTMHLEWLYRLIKQPFRFKRTFMAFPLFPLYVYKTIISHESEI